MKAAAVALGLLVTMLPGAAGPRARRAPSPAEQTLTGEDAAHLIGLLASASPAAAESLASTGQIVAHDLSVTRQPTFKLEADDPLYKIEVYSAKGALGAAADVQAIGEASALFDFFTRLGLEPQVSLGGSEHALHTISCRVDTHRPDTRPERYTCVISR